MVIELLVLREEVENMKPGRKPMELLDSLQNILGKKWFGINNSSRSNAFHPLGTKSTRQRIGNLASIE